MNICADIKKLIEDNLMAILKLRGQKTVKSDGSYVSEGDLLCESIIKTYINQHLPEYYLISEESPQDNLHSSKQEKILIIDPIDGTENFVSGLNEWGVAVCVYINGIHQQSMLALPELNKYLITGDKFERFSSRILGISSSLTKTELLQLKEGFEYRIIGCCVYNMLNVITGSFHTFENPKGAYVWDIIPGLNLAIENGLSVTINDKPYNGELLDPDQKYCFKIGQN